MKRISYKGRCEKRKVSKCTEVCRTYSKIQSAYVDVLEQDESIISFECNVLLEGVEGNQYSSDFVAKKLMDLRLSVSVSGGLILTTHHM